MSLYLQYRPQTFVDVVGQDHIVTTLENAVKHDKLAHAYLFAGIRGTGKTSMARILAKSIMTRGIDDETLRQQIETGIENGSLVDLIEIDGASNRGIDDVRDLIEKIQFSPVVTKAKVYIIDEVHMLTKEAFNALLKTLEEPPSYAYFILATTESHKVPATIVSRCQSFPFRRITTEDIVRRLQYIADREKIAIDREAIRAIALHSDGGLRDAISLLDQLRSLDTITRDDVEQRVGRSGREEVEKLLSVLQESDSAAVVELVGRIEESGMALDVFLRQILSVLRDQIHTLLSQKESVDWHVALLDVVLEALRSMRSAPVPGLVFEAALLSFCSQKTESVLSKASPSVPSSVLTKKEKEQESPPKAPELVKKEPPTTVEAADLSFENLKERWNDVLKAVSSASVRMSLKNGTLHSLNGTTLTIIFASGFHRDKVVDTAASREVEAAIKTIFQQDCTIECVTDTATDITADDLDIVNIADAASEIF